MLRGQPGLDVDVAAREIADALRQARSDAVVQNRDQLFALDVEQRLFRIGGQRAPVQIAKDYRDHVSDRALGDDERDDRSDPLLSGRQRDRRADRPHPRWSAVEVVVDWLTGLVSVNHAAPS